MNKMLSSKHETVSSPRSPDSQRREDLSARSNTGVSKQETILKKTEETLQRERKVIFDLNKTTEDILPVVDPTEYENY
jgi:hypothetical protein